MRRTSDKKLSVVLELEELTPGGLAFHNDVRLFMAALDLDKGAGAVLSWSPESGKLETIVPQDAGYWPNDLVFYPDGGFYFSNFRGKDASPTGGVYYVSPDFKKITPVIGDMAQANGVALVPDGKTLWATEFAKNRPRSATLADPVTISPIGSAGRPLPFYRNRSRSMRIDKSGNVYVALYGQGRVMIFNKLGLLIGQIQLPGRVKGENLLYASRAVNGARFYSIVATKFCQPFSLNPRGGSPWGFSPLWLREVANESRFFIPGSLEHESGTKNHIRDLAALSRRDFMLYILRKFRIL